MSFKKAFALLLLPASLLAFAWSCSDKTSPATPAAPVTIVYLPATNTVTNTSTITNSPTKTTSPTSTASPTATTSPTITNTPSNTATSSATQTNSPTPSPTRSHPIEGTVTPLPSNTWTLVATLGQYGTDGINGDFEFPYGVAVGSGFIAVSDPDFGNVQVFNSTGTYLYSIPASNPLGLAIDPYGELYVCNYGSPAEVDGYYLASDGYTYDYTWTGQGQVSAPYDVAIDANGNLVVAYGYPGDICNLSWYNDSILNLSTGDYGFLAPTGVALDSGGNIYAAGAIDNFYSVGEFNNSNYYLGSSFSGLSWSQPLGYCVGIGVDPTGNLYIADRDDARVVYATTNGTYLGEIDGGIPSGLALDNAGDLFVADISDFTVNEYTK